jgi:hypothetical protein
MGANQIHQQFGPFSGTRPAVRTQLVGPAAGRTACRLRSTTADKGAEMLTGRAASEDRREHPRHDTDWLSEVSNQTDHFSAVIVNVSLGGALVRAAPTASVRPGDCLRLRFRLPGALRIAVCAKVRWVSDRPNAEGQMEFGVRFYGLGRSEREAMVLHARHLSDAADESCDATVHKKYAVRRDGAKIWLWIAGSLNDAESRDLHALVVSRISERFGRPLLAFIDVRELATCQSSSLNDFRTWLKMLGRCRPLSGVLVAQDSIASAQVRRLVREAKIADSLVVFSEASQARDFWRDLEEAILNQGDRQHSC